MTAIDEPVIDSAPLPGNASVAVTTMVQRVKPSVVQVRGQQRGSGAGFVWSADGMVLTNHHVIAFARSNLEVVFPDGRTLPAQVVASEPAFDLALLQIEARDLPVVPVGDSTALRVGELVFAIGHPWGQRDVVTAGIVSGVGTVSNERGWHAQYIRSDVRLAPGNSGGPLLDAVGNVVGINAMIFGGDLGVAIPSHVARTWVNRLQGQRPFLGVSVQPIELPMTLRQNGHADRDSALLVVGLEADSPVAQAGMMVGDLLLDLGQTALLTPRDLVGQLAEHTVGEQVTITISRGGQMQTVQATIGSAER